MLRPRWRKVLSDLWDSKLRTALVVVSIMVGVFSVGMIAGAYAIISNDMSESYAASNPANIEFWAVPFNNDFVSTVQHMPGVQNAEGRQFVNLRVRTNGGQWTSMDLVAISDFKNSKINLLLPLEGAKGPADRQVLIERNALKKIPVSVGDVLEFQLSDGTLKQMPVTGIVLDQSTSAGDFLAAPLGYITYDTLAWLHQPENYNRLYVTVSGQPNNEVYIRQVADSITNKLEKNNYTVFRTQISLKNEHPMRSTVQAVLGVLGALGILIVFLSSSLIANTLNALLNQHIRHIGVMKLIGARSRQIFVMYITLIMAFGLIALVIAIPTGGQAAYALSQMIADQMNFNLLGYRIVPMAVLIQVAIALAVPLAAGFVPVNNGSRITVQKAISGSLPTPLPTKTNWFNRQISALTALSTRWLSRPLLISLRNTFRRKGRLALTLLTLSMGGAIFIAVFNVRVSLHQYVNNIGNYFLADVTLNFDRLYRIHEVQQTALQVKGVKAVEGWAYASAEILNPDKTVVKNLQVLAPPANSPLVSPMLLMGRWIQPGDQKAIAISEAILETFPDLKPGDSLRLKIANHDDGWKVVGVFKFIGSRELIAYADYSYVSDLLNQPEKAFTYRIVTDQHSKAYQKGMSTEIDKYFRDQGYHVSEVEAGQSTLETASQGLDVLITFLLIMALLTALVGSMGLTGTMGMNVLERTREIGVMRSIGAVDWVVVKTIMVEGLTIGLISFVIGSLLSFPISSLLATIIGLAIFNTPVSLIFTLVGFMTWLGLVLVLSTLASVLPARNAARLTIREVLAYE